MSGMTFGSILEADKRLRDHGAWQRRQKKALRDTEVWRRYEEDFDQAAQQQQQQQAQKGAGAGEKEA